MKGDTMKSISATAALALVLLSAGQLMAQPNHRGEHRGRERVQDRRHSELQRYERNPSERREQRGVGPNRNYYRGDRMPYQYRSYQYVVEDWRGHGLRVPPRGYHWVQNGGDYVLVAIATGIILEMLLSQ
jgi:Ni/Co efflux regulator RcnB